MPDAITLPDEMLAIRLAPLFALDIDAVQKVGGEAGAGTVGVVGGGRFEGMRLKGRVLAGGSDWQGVLSDGTVLLNCRIVLETDDGAMIAMTYRGVRAGRPEVFARLAAGEAVAPTEYYLRTIPLFQTRSPDYLWLNSIVAVGTGHRLPAGPAYNVFEVL